MVSHELRHLNSINGFVEVVIDGQVGQLNRASMSSWGMCRPARYS